MLKYELRSPDSLGSKDRDQLFTLMEDNYENLNRQRFEADLDAKTGAIVLTGDQGLIRGFSTYLVYPEPDLDCRVIYSGDTIIHPDSWGSPSLFYGFGSLLKSLMAEELQGQRIFWLLLSKGFRTFGLLPLFFQHFVPHQNQAPGEPWDSLGQLRDTLASRKFGALYQAGPALLPAGADYLNSRLAAIPDNKESNPWVRFFLDHNPDYHRGTELVCLTEITLDNILPPARRFVR